MKKATKVIAMILCMSMLMQNVSVCAESPENLQANAQAKSTQSAAAVADNTAKKVEPKILYEMTEKRTADTEQFKMSDGSFMTAQYPYPIHYNDKGTWKDIDNTLSANNQNTDSSSGGSEAAIKNGYKNSENSFDTKFAQQTDENNLVSVKSDNHQIAWGFADEDSQVSANSNTASSSNANSSSSMTSSAAENKTSLADSSSSAAEKTINSFSFLPSIAKNATSSFNASSSQKGKSSSSSSEQSSADSDSSSSQNLSEGLKTTQNVQAKPAFNRKSAAKIQQAAQNQASQDNEVKSFAASNSIASNTAGDVKKYNDQFLTKTKISSECTYSDVYPNVDVSYNLISDIIRENIILKNNTSQNTFTFSYKLGSLDMRKAADGSIEVYDPKDPGKAVYSIHKPFMTDASGVISDKVTMDFKKTGHTYSVTVTADQSFLNDASRKFPVKIDPDLQSSLDRNAIHETFVSQAKPNNNYTAYGDMLAGNDTSEYGVCHTYIRFDLPALDGSAMITSAEMGLYQYECGPGSFSNYQMDVHAVNGSCDTANMTWSNQPSYDSDVADYCMADSSDNWRTWNITKIVKSWYTAGNTGLMVKANNEADGTFVGFYTSDNASITSGGYPSFTIHYVENEGLEDYWTYHTNSAGRAGTSYVNDFTGKQTLIEDDYAGTGSRNPLSVYHVYNSEENLTTNSVLGFKLGCGWRLNLSQRLDRQYINGVWHLYYTDADGTRHFFDLKQGSSNVYTDEDGLNLTITQQSDGTYKMEDKKGNIEVFYSYGNLWFMKDANGNVNVLNYNSSNVLAYVIDAAGRKVTFTTDSSGYLTCITDPSGRKTQFGYEGGCLTSITYPDGQISRYGYDSNPTRYLNQVVAPNNQKIFYTNSSNQYQVRDIKECGTDGTLGEELSIDTSGQYWMENKVKFSDNHGHSYTYHFDDAGRTVDVVDGDGSAEMYDYSNDSANKNKTTSEQRTMKPVYNLVSDPGFEESTSSTLSGYSFGSGVTYSVSRQTSGGHNSNNCALVTKSSANSTAGVEINTPSLGGGNYTLSAYVKTSNLVSVSGAGAGVVVTEQVVGSSKTVTSQLLQGTDSNVDNGWQRVSVTFDATSATNIKLIGAIFNTTGQAYFDDFQLEKGEVANNYNYIDNGSFERNNGSSDSIADKWNCATAEDTRTWTPASTLGMDGNWSYRLIGRADQKKTVYQVINVKGKEGDDFVLSGWAKANAVPITDSGKRAFGLSAVVVYDDGTLKGTEIPFNTDTDDWQFASHVVSTDDNNSSTNKTYKQIIIYLQYKGQQGEAFFDGIQFYRDSSQSYTYDSNGNLVTTVNKDKQQSQFDYDSSNNLIKATKPNGASYNYTYDDKHNVTEATNCSNVSYTFKYDNLGNPVSSTTSGSNSDDSIASGKTYYIKSAASGMYLDANNYDQSFSNVVQSKYTGKLGQRWKLIQSSNGDYELVSIGCADGKVLDVMGGLNNDGQPLDIFGENGSAAQKWKIAKNSDGTFSFSSACSSYSKCLTIPNSSNTEGTVIQQCMASGSQYQKFTLEDAGDISENLQPTTSITSGTKYYIKAKVSNLYVGWNDYAGGNLDKIVQKTYDGSPDEQWKLVSLGNGYYKIVNGWDFSTRVIDVAGGSSSNGASIDLYDDNGSNAQKWYLNNNGDGTFSLGSECSNCNQALDVTNASSASGTALIQHNYSSGDQAEKFILEPVPSTLNTAPATTAPVADGEYYIQSKCSRQFLEPANESGNSNARIVQGLRSGGTFQRWKISKNSDGYYSVINTGANLSLDLANNQDANDAVIESHYINGSEAQEWSFIKNSDGSFKISPKCSSSGRVLDDANASLAPQNYIMLFTSNGGSNQSWNLIPTNETKNTMQTSATYTSNGNYMSSLTDTRGNTTSYDYDQTKGTLQSETDPNGSSANYSYNPDNDALTGVSETVGGQTVSNGYTYDNDDKLTQINHNGFSYGLNYDAHGNESSVNVGNQNLITNTYEPNDGNLTRATYGNGQYDDFSYNSNDQVTGRKYNGNYTYRWVYDALGNIGIYKDLVNNVNYTYAHDLADRITSFSGTNGHSENFSYDVSNNLVKTVESLSGGSFVTNYNYNKDNLPTNLSINKNDSVSWNYDGLSRLSQKTFTMNSSNSFAANYTYLPGAGNNTTTLVSKISYSKNGSAVTGRDLSYTYDKNGNIATISEGGTLKATYHYDELNELTREDNLWLNKTIVYSYDAGGNLTAKTEYPYTTSETLGTPTAQHSYSYGDDNWKDKLTSYDGNNITYDAIGNPTAYYNGWNFTWQEGRQLASAKNSTNDISYKYDSDGVRTSKTVNGKTTTYYLDGDNIAWQTDGTNTIHYTYDANSDLEYMNLNGTLYYYERNGQNDIVGLVDSNMNEVVRYSYDTWGKLLSINDNSGKNVGAINPFRYRGYYYDTETGLYYLQSRYYDPNTGRLLNADDTDMLSDHNDLVEANLFAYCLNNPVKMADENGHLCELVAAAFVAGGPAGWIIGAFLIVSVAAITYIAIDHYRYTHRSAGTIQYSKPRNKPKEQGIPNSSELHKDRYGNIDGYTTYGKNGEVRKQARCKGKSHGKIKRPNIKVPKYNTNPKTGKRYKNGYRVRKPWKWELPKGYR